MTKTLERHNPMTQILQNIEAGDIPSELARLGISPRQKMRVVLIEPIDDDHKDAAWEHLFEISERTTAYAKSQGMTEETLNEILRDE
jgi:hypothetical protein